MYNYKETGLISKLLLVTMILIMVVGITAGIGLGGTLKQPTEKALEAIEDIKEYPTLYGDDLEKWEEAEETEWTFKCTFVMLETWVIAAILALFTFYKKHQLEMLDQITLSLDKLKKE